MSAPRLLVRQAAFAEMQGWHKSTVTRLKAAGRLVMSGRLVDVDASLARIEETGGMRFDVSARHAAGRAQKIGADATATPGKGVDMNEAAIAPPASNPPAPRGAETRADAQARKESAQADIAEMEAKEKRGLLIPKDDVDAALKALGASVRARLDVLADQLAPLLAPIADLEETHALLAEHLRAVLAGIADDLARQGVCDV